MGHAAPGARSGEGVRVAAVPDAEAARDRVPGPGVGARPVGHEEAVPVMRIRAILALGAVAAFVLGGTLLRDVRPKALGTAEPLGAAAGSWFCPHGGGDGWRGQLSLTNPGSRPVTARVTDIGAKGSTSPRTVDVPPNTSIRVPVDSS